MAEFKTHDASLSAGDQPQAIVEMEEVLETGRRGDGLFGDVGRAGGSRYEPTVTIRYPLELGLAVWVPRKKERRRQRPSAGGLHESRATPSAPV